MKRLNGLIAATAALGALALAASANAAVHIDISQTAGGVDVTASGSLDLTGATFDHQQPYGTGVIPGGSNWYVALGSTAGMDWYQLTGVTLPYGTSNSYYTAPSSGDAISIWGESGAANLVGVSTGYVSGTAISANMLFAGETLADMTLMPGTYTFSLPNDTVVLTIDGGAGVPEPATWAMLLLGVGCVGAAMRSTRREARATA